MGSPSVCSELDPVPEGWAIHRGSRSPVTRLPHERNRRREGPTLVDNHLDGRNSDLAPLGASIIPHIPNVFHQVLRFVLLVTEKRAVLL